MHNDQDLKIKIHSIDSVNILITFFHFTKLNIDIRNTMYFVVNFKFTIIPNYTNFLIKSRSALS